MPLLTPHERCQLIMKTVHKEPMTADHLAKFLDIPIATVRKTISRDYPYCFSRDYTNRRLITITGEWPDGRWFELEPELVAKRQAEEERRHTQETHKWKATYLKTVKYTDIPMNIKGWIMAGKAPSTNNKTARAEFITAINRYKMIVLILEMLLSDKPFEVVPQYVDDPRQLDEWQRKLFNDIVNSRDGA